MRLLFEIDKKDYNPDDSKFIRPSARGIIFRDGKLSVIYSQKEKFYSIPGGGIEEGEEKEVSLIREVKEEVGLTVILESIKEFGYVHRIQKGKHEGIFEQDNYYYFCDAEDGQEETDMTESEKRHEFVPMFVTLEDAITVNEKYLKANPMDAMIERELRIMKMVRDRML